MNFEERLEKISSDMADSETKISLHLNFETRRAVGEVPRLKKKKKHKRISTQSFDEVVQCLNVFNDVNRGNLKARDRLRFVHMGRRQTFSEMFMPTPVKRHYVYDKLQRTEAASPSKDGYRRLIHPCIIPLAPHYSEADSFVDSSKNCFEMASDSRVMKEIYDFNIDLKSEDFLQKTGWALAWASITKENPRILTWYIHGNNSMIEREFTIAPKPQLLSVTAKAEQLVLL